MTLDIPPDPSEAPPTEAGAFTIEGDRTDAGNTDAGNTDAGNTDIAEGRVDDDDDSVGIDDARSIHSATEQIPMHFIDVIVDLPSTNPVVILAEVDAPHRVLRIPIGLPEGVAISYAMSGIGTPRPLTHVLMTSILESFSLTVEVMRITSVKTGVYAAELIVSGPAGTKVFDCRPSDGIALALHQGIVPPLTAAGAVLDLMGIAGEETGSALPS